MRVKTPCRLHFGIIDLSRKFEREYGALGITLKDGYTLKLNSTSEGIEVRGNEREKKVISGVYTTLKEKYDISGGFEVTVEERIPSHVGLGSTTQLKLGSGHAIMKESGIDTGVKKLAKVLKRGRYSAIGTHGFQRGGFILEGGKRRKEEISPLLFRSEVPEDWRFLIICPKEKKGYDEKEERPIMEELKVEERYPEKICHNILMGILPALKREDIEDFGEHLTEIQRLVGESFSDFQEGVYHPSISDLMDSLVERTYGAGQSSWGPTAYGLVRSDEVEEIKKEVLPDDRENYRVWVGEPDNHGVRVEK